jgi:excisionase family DNA binding protein
MKQQEGTSDTDMMTVLEVGTSLRISRWSVYKLLRRGLLASVKIGDRRLVPRHSLEEFVRRIEEEGGPRHGRQAW